ncbi:MAG: hypothetical protein ABIA37_03195 [Candidatus Woesearchaeota archaeon]
MRKRGQVTIFIIVGILIVGIVIGIIFLSTSLTKKQLEAQENGLDTNSVKLFVDSCLEKTAKEGIDLVARQGGYFDLPELSTENATTNTAYYFYFNKSYLPSQETVKKELEKYVETQLPFCLRNFVDFKGLEFAVGKPTASVGLNQASVSVELNFPITITKDNTQQTVENFAATISTRLSALYDSAKELTAIQLQYPTEICMSCIDDVAEQNQINISVVEFEEDALIFVLKDETGTDEESLRYRYANRYLPPE